MENLLSTGRVASRLGISRQAVYRLVARGTLPARWVCGRLLIQSGEVARLESDERYLRRSRRRD